nr:hypothetical protein CFP56_11771 [Quercus suber]
MRRWSSGHQVVHFGSVDSVKPRLSRVHWWKFNAHISTHLIVLPSFGAFVPGSPVSLPRDSSLSAISAPCTRSTSKR